MPRPTAVVVVSEDQRAQIEQWLAALGTPQQVALRCRIVLAVGLGKSEAAIAAELRVNRKTVRLWRGRPGHPELLAARGQLPPRPPRGHYSPRAGIQEARTLPASTHTMTTTQPSRATAAQR